MSTAARDSLTRYRDNAYKRLLIAARRSLERTGGALSGNISLSQPTDAERIAVTGLTGVHRKAGTSRLTISLAALDASLRQAIGLGLVEVVEAVDGRALRNLPAERAARQAARATMAALAEASPLHQSQQWYRDWTTAIAADGTLTALDNRQDTRTLPLAMRVLEHLYERPDKSAPLMLPALAETTTGDTKALNPDRGTLPTLVLRALAAARAVPPPTNAEQRRELWDSFDVIVDDLASRVLVLNLPAQGPGLGNWLTDAARRGIPFYVTLHQLLSLPIAVNEHTVHVCENPAVLRRAAGEIGPGAWPLLCTEGRPSTAFHRMARAITAAGGQLKYHGDFDWPGVDITNSLITRHGAQPWQMSAADYEEATGKLEFQALTGKPQPTSWDPELAAAMSRHNRAVYEEAVADQLLQDLRGPGASP